MWMAAATFRRTHSPSWLAWSEGCRPPGTQSAFIKWTGWTLAIRHKDSTINIVVFIIIIIIIIIIIFDATVRNSEKLRFQISLWLHLRNVHVCLAIFPAIYIFMRVQLMWNVFSAFSGHRGTKTCMVYWVIRPIVIQSQSEGCHLLKTITS